MAKRFSVEAVFRAVDRVTAPINKMQNRVGKFTRSMQRGFRRVNRQLGKITSGIKKVGMVAAGVALSTSLALAKVVNTGAEFEQAITNVGAVSLKTVEQIKPLESLALELGRTTRFTATQAANAMEIMARAGFNMNEILAGTPAVLSAAAASGLEIAEVADVVSNALKGMGLETNQAGRVADVLTLASARTNSSMGSLGESLKNVASTAKQLGIPLEETVAAIALLQDVGLDASVAGSAFNTMLTKMAAPTKGMAKKMKDFGISFKDAKGDMLLLADVLKQLSIASEKAGGNFDKVAFFAELVGLRGQKATANLIDLFEAGKLNELVNELKNTTDSAKKMSEIRMNTFQGSMLLLGSAIDGVKVKIFSLQDGALKSLVDKMTEWVSLNHDVIASGIGEFISMIVENAGMLVNALTDIALGVGAIFALSLALKAVTVVLGIINVLMAANPIVLGIMAAVAAVALLSGALDPVINMLKSIGSGISSAFNAVTKIGNLFTFGGADGEPGGRVDDSPSIVSPQERAARIINEQRTTSTSEVTIRPAQGVQADVTGGRLGPGLSLQPAGDF